MAYKKLFTPIEINGMKLENRIVMAPAHEGLAHGGYCTPEYSDYYLRRAEGGAAMRDVSQKLRRLLFLVPYVARNPEGVPADTLAEQVGVNPDFRILRVRHADGSASGHLQRNDVAPVQLRRHP